MSDAIGQEGQSVPPVTAEQAHSQLDVPAYRKFVTDVADGRIKNPDGSAMTILNKSFEHAAVVAEVLFNRAQRTILILSSRLDKSVYGNTAVIQAARNFLAKQDARLSILVEEQIDAARHPFLMALHDFPPGKLSVLNVSPQISARYPFNFAVADGQAYRFEQNKKTFEAVVGFDNQDGMGVSLSRFFESIYTAAGQAPPR